MQNHAPLEVESRFFATGWMADGEDGTRFIDLLERCNESPHSGPTCIKVTYKDFGPRAGVEPTGRMSRTMGETSLARISQRPGTRPSRSGQKSAQGGELVEFKAGDIAGEKKKYKDSFRTTAGKVFLTQEWQKFYMDLQGKDLSV